MLVKHSEANIAYILLIKILPISTAALASSSFSSSFPPSSSFSFFSSTLLPNPLLSKHLWEQLCNAVLTLFSENLTSERVLLCWGYYRLSWKNSIFKDRSTKCCPVVPLSHKPGICSNYRHGVNFEYCSDLRLALSLLDAVTPDGWTLAYNFAVSIIHLWPRHASPMYAKHWSYRLHFCAHDSLFSPTAPLALGSFLSS